MSTDDKPLAVIEKQTQTNTVSTDSTLVDDAVVLVDDTTALVGGLTTSVTVTRSTIEEVVPRLSIPLRR